MALLIGEMRHSITVKSLSSTVDEFGSRAETFSDLMTLKASLKYISGTKTVDSREIFNSQVLQFSTHYRPAIVETCQIVFEDKKYRILSISPIGYREGLIINCELINE